ncbi:MAG: carboxynorspermidine decarboxylase [Candidatus Omnitrophota bacterium]|jgi:carboxynorspermidine decarboxylase
MKLETPYYLINEKALLSNLRIIGGIKKASGAKCVLALKCFAAWSVFGLIRQYMDGTTSSSPYEARLGHEKFGKEVHVYSPGYKRQDIFDLRGIADKIIFNSVSQLKTFGPLAGKARLGIRINPGISYSHFDLADPARKYCRLGVPGKRLIRQALPYIDGVMFHFNCENTDFENLRASIDYIGNEYKDILKYCKWVSLGGGIYFTRKGYPVEDFCAAIRDFAGRFNTQVYLEPGESVIMQSAELVCSVLDVVRNKTNTAIVDASTEAHMLDLLIYSLDAKVNAVEGKGFRCAIAGRSCLAGDIFGSYRFKRRPRPGDIIRFKDAGGYTMVKKNWFNGLQMPAIVVKRLNGKIDIVRKFGYKDFVDNLS